jgi:hypothetical protein
MKTQTKMKNLIFMQSFLLTGLYLKVIFLGLMLMSFALTGKTQNSDNATIKAIANLIGEISVTNEQDLNFGDIGFAAPTTVSTMDTEDRGRFFIEMGPGNPNVNLTFTLPEELEHSGDGPGLEIGDWTYRIHTANVAISDEVLPNTSIPLNMAGGMPRERYVFVGATVTPNEENWVGAYEGDVTLTVEYN